MHFVLQILLFAVSSKRVRVHDGQTSNHSLADFSLRFSAHQKIITPLNVSQAYDVDVFDGKSVRESPYIPLDHEYLDEFKLDNECVGLPLHPKLHEQFEYEILAQTEDMFYNDILALPDHNKIYLITDKLLLMQGTLIEGMDFFNFSMSNHSTQLSKNFDQYANAQFVRNQKLCLIFTTIGGYWLDVDQAWDSENSSVAAEPAIIPRSEFETVHSYGDYIAVAAGQAGVDIYKIQSNKTIVHSYTLSLNEFQVKSLYVLSLKLQWGRLSVLDEYNGLFIFDFQDGQKPTLVMQVYIPRCVAFDHHGNTYLVVAETQNNIQFVSEIFVQIATNEFYINRIFVEDFSVKDIEMMENYAIIIGEDVHMVIRYGIFNGFLKNNKELVKTFFQNELMRFEQFGTLVLSQNQKFREINRFIGLSKGSLSIWRLLEYSPVIICQFSGHVEKEFVILANSTVCPNSSMLNWYDQCHLEQKFQVSVMASFIESDMLPIILGAIAIVLVLIMVVIFLLCKKGRSMIEQIKDLKEKQDKYKRIQDNEGSIV